MIKLTINTRAVTTPPGVDHGISILWQTSPDPVTLGDSLIYESTNATGDLTVDLAELMNLISPAIATIPNPKPTGRLRRALNWCRRQIGRAVQAVRTARGAAAWVTTASVGVAARAGDWWRRYRADYVGRHRTLVTWYGRERSTAEFVAQLRAMTQRESSGAKEDDLSDLLDVPRDVAFIGWLAACIQVMRDEQVVMHEPGRHFICS